MAGTADNFSSTTVAIGPGKLYAGLAIPGAGGRLILASDGTPDATQNPNAIHLGYTEGGTEWKQSHTLTSFNADESNFPIVSRITAEEASISGSLLQIMDFDIDVILNPLNVRSNLVGTQGATLGGMTTFSYNSVAVVFPIEGSSGPVVYGVFHLYKAVNDAGGAAKVTSKALGASPFSFKGHAISTRAAGDQVGRKFRQNAGAAS
jgi:hypothetical protein